MKKKLADMVEYMYSNMEEYTKHVKQMWNKGWEEYDHDYRDGLKLMEWTELSGEVDSECLVVAYRKAIY
jgi:hypothetical protein